MCSHPLRTLCFYIYIYNYIYIYFAHFAAVLKSFIIVDRRNMQEHLPFFCHISQLGLCRTIGNAVIKLETKAQTNCYVMPTIGPNSKMGCQSACVNRRPQGVPD